MSKAPKQLYRFYVSTACGGDTSTLAIVLAETDGEAFDLGFKVSHPDAVQRARTEWAIPDSSAADYVLSEHDADEDASFFTVEAIEDKDRAENALSDLSPDARFAPLVARALGLGKDFTPADVETLAGAAETNARRLVRNHWGVRG